MAQNQNPVSVNSLQSSPLFHLSLTSKELFHSNFLYWLGKTYQDLFQETFSILGCRTAAWPDKWEVEREYKAAKSISLDLCVKGSTENEKIYLVLENKVKSIPNQQQLDNYYNAISKVNPECDFGLLSLATNFPNKDQVDVDSGGKWIVWNYGNLADALNKALSSSEDKVNFSYHKAIIKDYIQLAKGLHGLFGKLTVDEGSRYNYKYKNKKNKKEDEELQEDKELREYIDLLKQLRMEDVYEKIRTSLIAEQLRNRLKKKFPNQTIDIKSELKIEEIGESNEKPLTKVYVDSGYTNKQGVVNAKVKIDNRYVLTVQIQGEQYRHAIEWFNTTEDKWAQTQQENLPSDWFSSTAHDNQLDDQTKDYCKYVTKSSNSILLYCYRKIEDNETVDNVLDEVVKDICHIFETYGSALTTQLVHP